MALLSLVTNILLFGSLAIVVGVIAARWWVIPKNKVLLRTDAARIGTAGAGAWLIALVLVMTRQLLEFRDPFVPWTDDLSLLLGTSWGTSWKGAVAVGGVTLGAFIRARRGSRVAWGMATLSVLLSSVFPALTGHASGGDGARYTVPADVAHVLAMGSWVGTLAVVLLLDRARRRAGVAPAGVLDELIPRFSPLAMAGVAVLILSGTVGMWAHLDRPLALIETAYGRWLTLKLILVGGVLVLGAINFRRLLPRLDEEAGAVAMRRSASREVALALVVLAVTAILVRTPPG
ncbi:copper resistance D family protein [Gaopeijia maritima]|uniref:CopD family protein n=1 Tax=Gaopeijia maritima TaxID=3119007 RepID=A0ABU9E782_9BACT